MHRHFEENEEELKNRLLHMGSLAEEMIHLAVKGLMDRTDRYCDDVFAKEKEVNELHIEVDDRCLKILALFQPAADDLRFVMAASKINSDLERIADQGVNITQTSRFFLQNPPLERRFFDIPRMAEFAKKMVKDSLDAFVNKDVELAQSVLTQDAEEDKMKREAFNELMQLMQADSSTVQRALGLILISRNLERIADHATNIAEDVIFMVQGRDIRHHVEEKSPPV